MGAALEKMFFKKGVQELKSNYQSLNEIEVREALQENPKRIAEYSDGNKLLIVVNIATR